MLFSHWSVKLQGRIIGHKFYKSGKKKVVRTEIDVCVIRPLMHMIGWRKGASWVLLLTYVTVSTSFIIHVTQAHFHSSISSIHLDSCSLSFHTFGHFLFVKNPCATGFNIQLSTSCSICIILVVGQKTLGMHKQISSQCRCSAKKESDHLNSAMKAFNHIPRTV